MSDSICNFLEGLFDDPVTVPSATVPKTTPADDTSAAEHPLAGTPFNGWVRRQDCTGRMGWEAPELPEADRWWVRCTFDDLPEVPDGFQFGKIE